MKLKNHHEAHLPPSHFQQDPLVSDRVPDGLYPSPFIPESIHVQKKSGSSMKVFSEKCTSSNFENEMHNPSMLARLEYHQSALSS